MANWLQKLQEADEGEKKIYVVAGTILATTIVIAVWLTWFNNFDVFSGVPGAENTTANIGENVQEAHGFSAWESVRGFFGGLGSVFQAEREYIVKPEQSGGR
jgi:hypothetical protein